MMSRLKVCAASIVIAAGVLYLILKKPIDWLAAGVK